jgi:aminopeptidase N
MSGPAASAPSSDGTHEVRRLFALNNHLGVRAHCSAEIIAEPVSAGGEPQPVYRADYKAPDYLIPAVELHFALGVGEEHTIVTGSLSCERVGAAGAPLVLDGEGLNLLQLTINGAPVAKDMYTITAETNASTTLTISGAVLPVSATFTVETTVEIFPEANHQGDGLYMSNATFCTQCEPQGFRRITFNQDRPDILCMLQCNRSHLLSTLAFFARVRQP